MRLAAHRLALRDMHHAGAAGAGAAVERNLDAVGERAIEQHVARADAELAALDGDDPEVRHDQLLDWIRFGCAEGERDHALPGETRMRFLLAVLSNRLDQ